MPRQTKEVPIEESVLEEPVSEEPVSEELEEAVSEEPEAVETEAPVIEPIGKETRKKPECQRVRKEFFNMRQKDQKAHYDSCEGCDTSRSTG